MARAMPAMSEIFMWRLNCPASEVLMTWKRSDAIWNAATSVSNAVPNVALSHAARWAHSAPIHDSMRLVGKSAFLGPKSTVSMMKCLQRNAAIPTSTTASAPRTRWGRRASMCSKKVISEDSGSACFMWRRAVEIPDVPIGCYFSESFSTVSCFRAVFSAGVFSSAE